MDYWWETERYNMAHGFVKVKKIGPQTFCTYDYVIILYGYGHVRGGGGALLYVMSAVVIGA